MDATDVAEKLDAQVTVKMPTKLLSGLQRIKERHGLEPAETLRRLGAGAVDFYDTHGWFGFPVTIEPQEDVMRAVQKISETKASKKDKK